MNGAIGTSAGGSFVVWPCAHLPIDHLNHTLDLEGWCEEAVHANLVEPIPDQHNPIAEMFDFVEILLLFPHSLRTRPVEWVLRTVVSFS